MENKQKIRRIEMAWSLRVYCPLGHDWYSAEVAACVIPGRLLADFIDVDSKVSALNNRSMIIEDLAASIRDVLLESFGDCGIEVSVAAKTESHMPVTVVV